MAGNYIIKFLFADGVSMEQEFEGTLTVVDCKKQLIAKWPEGKEPVEGPDDLKMIHAGKVLENEKTFEDYRVTRGSQVIMHLQNRPAQVQPEKKPDASTTSKKAPGGSCQCCTVS
mmetsp:Transcript_69846/g.145644  ORF Transcript_69846/g.145644 Transcript_69846/m.145644 type:complete len:115 (+) Transcript_69846:313-657(+)